MTLQYKGGARTPGPLGGPAGTLGGRIPGPLGFKHVDAPKGTATKAAKVLAMPTPASGSSAILRARSVAWPLLNKDSLLPEDVKQGELDNCPIPAILAALAHTASGKKRLDSLITEYAGDSKTTFSKDIVKELSSQTDGDPDYRAPDNEVMSKRYFSVNLGAAIEVSDVFYMRYTDGTDVDMIYMGSPKEALWPCVIEKAYASKIGGYEELNDASKHTINEFWTVLVGSQPGGFAIDEKTDLTTISEAAKVAGRVPTIGASRVDATKVVHHHGFAILGIQGSTIELYNPHGNRVKLSVADFRSSFQAVFFGNP
jgi:hypothetical protein